MQNNRFKMSFNSLGFVPQNNNLGSNLTPVNNLAPVKNYPVQKQVVTNTALNSPMISRVYKAKPGCSACGKKVA
jgi:hypothetical protein